MRVSYGARWLPRNRMRGNRRSVGSKCPAGHRQTPSAGGDLHDRRLHGHRAGSDVVGVELTEANPWVTGSAADPRARSCTDLTQYRRSEMTVIICTSAVTVCPVRVMMTQQVPLGSRWPIAHRGDCDVIVAAGVITLRYNSWGTGCMGAFVPRPGLVQLLPLRSATCPGFSVTRERRGVRKLAMGPKWGKAPDQALDYARSACLGPARPVETHWCNRKDCLKSGRSPVERIQRGR
jgi:hypothetical protein